jgi:hypothetical protein
MRKQGGKTFFSRLSLGQCHPVRLQQEIADEMFQAEQYV